MEIGHKGELKDGTPFEVVLGSGTWDLSCEGCILFPMSNSCKSYLEVNDLDKDAHVGCVQGDFILAPRLILTDKKPAIEGYFKTDNIHTISKEIKEKQETIRKCLEEIDNLASKMVDLACTDNGED